VLWRFDPAAENPLVISPPIIAEMNTMLNSVAENGTGKRALLPGIKIAGKTGTTNSYRDAWFMGFSGNLVGGVWYGNDDYKPTNKMTGGTLPAMTWQQVMAFAHQDLDIRPIPGVAPFEAGQGGLKVAAAKDGQAAGPDVVVQKPGVISRRTAGVLGDIGSMFDDAQPAREPDTTSAIDQLGRTVSSNGGVTTGGGVSFSGGKWIFR
jgi:penicillin-binding protein 1A